MLHYFFPDMRGLNRSAFSGPGIYRAMEMVGGSRRLSGSGCPDLDKHCEEKNEGNSEKTQRIIFHGAKFGSEQVRLE